MRRLLGTVVCLVAVVCLGVVAGGGAAAAAPQKAEAGQGDAGAGAVGDAYYGQRNEAEKGSSWAWVRVPAGSYVVTGSMNPSLEQGFAQIECHLRSSPMDESLPDDRDGLLFLTLREPPADGGRAFARAQSEAAFTVGPDGARISFHCHASSGTAKQDVEFARARIIAIRVAGLKTFPQ